MEYNNYKGIYEKGSKKRPWVAIFRGKHLGSFRTYEEAFIARQDAIKKAQKENASEK